MQNGLNWCNYCKTSCHEVVSEFFAKNAPSPHHWTLEPCFCAFRSVWVHLGLFHYCMKLDAKWAELVQLMQKFVPRSRVGIVRNASTQSIPLDPKLMFWSVCYYLGAFTTVWLPYKTRCSCDCLVGSQNLMENVQNWCESSCHEVALELFATNTPDPPHWTLNSCSGLFQTNFTAFGTVWLAYKNSVQNGPTGAKVRATNRVGNLRNECTQSS